MNKQRIHDRTTDYHETLMMSLSDKEHAKVYLQVALEEYESDNDASSFMMALRNVVDAQGGVGKVAKKARLNRPNLYKVLSSNGNPKLLTLDNVLKTLGFRLSIEAI